MGGNGSSADMVVVAVGGEKIIGRHWVRENEKVGAAAMRRATLILFGNCRLCARDKIGRALLLRTHQHVLRPHPVSQRPHSASRRHPRALRWLAAKVERLRLPSSQSVVCCPCTLRKLTISNHSAQDGGLSHYSRSLLRSVLVLGLLREQLQGKDLVRVPLRRA